MTRRVSVPAPEEMIRGIDPAAVVIPVMIMGRNRVSAASISASRTSLPMSRSWVGKFDNQSAILRRQADRHDEPNLAMV